MNSTSSVGAVSWIDGVQKHGLSEKCNIALLASYGSVCVLALIVKSSIGDEVCDNSGFSERERERVCMCVCVGGSSYHR